MNKKSTIDISLRTILGLVLAIIVLVIILYFIKDILAIFLPGPSAITMANFNRLGDEINNLKENSETVVPYFMVPEDKVKLVSQNMGPDVKINPNCYPSNCICICKNEINGCSKFKERICFRGYDVTIENPGSLDIENYNERINLLSVRKEPGKITIKDIALACKPGEICCQTIDTTGEVQTVSEFWSTNESCKEKEGWNVPCSLCPHPI